MAYIELLGAEHELDEKRQKRDEARAKSAKNSPSSSKSSNPAKPPTPTPNRSPGSFARFTFQLQSSSKECRQLSPVRFEEFFRLQRRHAPRPRRRNRLPVPRS